MKRAGILGASGYAGQELRRLLARHPSLELSFAMSARKDESPEPPALPFDPAVAPFDAARLAEVDAVLLCTPHGTSAELARQALAAGVKVVDLSADFRLRDPEVYAEAYGHAHPAPDLLGEAVYGLTERARDRVRAARLVANPGCYPTCILLALLPLLDAGLLDPEAKIIADAKSGVSGAGKKPTERTVFGSVHDSCSAYAVGSHRHTPEIWQEAGTERIVFVPHLLPLFRGMLATLYLPPARGVSAQDVRACLEAAYRGERFVRVYPRGLPEVDRVAGSNLCDLGVAQAQGLVVVVSALDNLVKGAAGQALQNLNLMLGLPEEAGLA